MARDFHEKRFSDETELKLELFRLYTREWLSVFLTLRSKELRSARVYDFFAGPGRDAEGNPGSPLIALHEVAQYYATRSNQRGDLPIYLYFADSEEQHVEALNSELTDIEMPPDCYVQCERKEFEVAFSDKMLELRSGSVAALVIMDQFGIREVTPQIVQTLSRCRTTDMLFFIASSYIHRFYNMPGFAERFPKRDLAECDYEFIHREVCAFFREQVGVGYYLAPFSIKKGSNIYGVIFGSGNLRGLEKFLQVCWNLDPNTGEANYNIDGDLLPEGGQTLLFKRKPRKIDIFERDVEQFIRHTRPDNKQLYQLSLEHGLPPKQANKVLRNLQKEGRIYVEDLITGGPARKNSFYLSYKNFANEPKVRFRMP